MLTSAISEWYSPSRKRYFPVWNRRVCRIVDIAQRFSVAQKYYSFGKLIFRLLFSGCARGKEKCSRFGRGRGMNRWKETPVGVGNTVESAHLPDQSGGQEQCLLEMVEMRSSFKERWAWKERVRKTIQWCASSSYPPVRGSHRKIEHEPSRLPFSCGIFIREDLNHEFSRWLVSLNDGLFVEISPKFKFKFLRNRSSNTGRFMCDLNLGSIFKYRTYFPPSSKPIYKSEQIQESPEVYLYPIQRLNESKT